MGAPRRGAESSQESGPGEGLGHQVFGKPDASPQLYKNARVSQEEMGSPG